MAGIFLLLALCVVMALASFLAGALPLSMTLSQAQLRFISSLGVGILVGTSLIVIIPEGIEAAATPGESSHIHRVRTLIRRSPCDFAFEPRDVGRPASAVSNTRRGNYVVTSDDDAARPYVVVSRSTELGEKREDEQDEPVAPTPEEPEKGNQEDNHDEHDHDHDEKHEIPTFEIGSALIAGFVLMFLIDRLPRHATERLQAAPQTQHMSLDSLGVETQSVDEEADGFLGSLAPTPRHARSLATTTGLVIHAAADGIAMGASSTTSDMKLGFIIFIAIMIHKAPAAFGLTSLLLKQGLSKRAARGHLIIFSLAAPVGALTTWLLIVLLGGNDLNGESGQWWTGMLLLFSGGTFLYVAMHAMQDDGSSHSHDHGSNGYADGNSVNQRKPKGPRIRDTMGTIVGMLLPLLTQFGHHH